MLTCVNLWSCPHCAHTSPSPTIHTERDIIGLTESSRLVYFAAQADLEDRLTVSRAMLKRLTLTQTCGSSLVPPRAWERGQCSRTSLLQTPLGSRNVSCLVRQPQFRNLHCSLILDQLYVLAIIPSTPTHTHTQTPTYPYLLSTDGCSSLPFEEMGARLPH